MTNCTYHCRPCGAHFTSLTAFDLHRQEGKCSFTGLSKKLKKTEGTCNISDGKSHPAKVYELARTEEYRKFRNAEPQL